MIRLSYVAGAAMALAMTACAKQEPADNVVIEDTTMPINDLNMTAPTAVTLTDEQKSFLDEAIRGDIGETRIGTLAQQKGQSQAAKDFGATLATDHSAHLAKLTALAQSAGVTVPSEPTDEAKTNHDKLDALTGAEFDAALKTAMIEDHQKDIAKYQAQAEGTGPLADLARETVPTLQKHLEAAQKL